MEKSFQKSAHELTKFWDETNHILHYVEDADEALAQLRKLNGQKYYCDWNMPYKGFGNCDSICNVKFFPPDLDDPKSFLTVIFTELPNNHGTSVTNAIETCIYTFMVYLNSTSLVDEEGEQVDYDLLQKWLSHRLMILEVNPSPIIARRARVDLTYPSRGAMRWKSLKAWVKTSAGAIYEHGTLEVYEKEYGN